MFVKIISYWHKFQTWARETFGLYGMRWHVVTWCGHGSVVLVMAWIGGVPGYIFGVGFYCGREALELEGDPAFQKAPWWDHLGDIGGPLLLGLIGVLLHA